MTTTRTINDEGVDTIAFGDQANGVVVTILPAGEVTPLLIEVEGRGTAVIADGGIRLDRDQAIALTTELLTWLTS